eukprot:GHVR01053351.1.p1 GENE.GHVR01053351.1~~GHVR01053351.1.p1  ORF type:complete len:276 (-),score=74.34 GHVR01053351.1:382-1209(-)
MSFYSHAHTHTQTQEIDEFASGNADSQPECFSATVLPTHSRGERVPRLPLAVAIGYDPVSDGERAPPGWKDESGVERSATLARLDGEGKWFGYHYKSRELRRAEMNQRKQQSLQVPSDKSEQVAPQSSSTEIPHHHPSTQQTLPSWNLQHVSTETQKERTEGTTQAVREIGTSVASTDKPDSVDLVEDLNTTVSSDAQRGSETEKHRARMEMVEWGDRLEGGTKFDHFADSVAQHECGAPSVAGNDSMHPTPNIRYTPSIHTDKEHTLKMEFFTI